MNGFLNDCAHGNCLGCNCICHEPENKISKLITKIQQLQKDTLESLDWYKSKIRQKDFRNIHEEYTKHAEVKIYEKFNEQLKRLLND